MYVSNSARGMLQTAATGRTVAAHHLLVKHCFLFSSVGRMLKWLTFGKKKMHVLCSGSNHLSLQPCCKINVDYSILKRRIFYKI
jgi:hypothetical protein